MYAFITFEFIKYYSALYLIVPKFIFHSFQFAKIVIFINVIMIIISSRCLIPTKSVESRRKKHCQLALINN